MVLDCCRAWPAPFNPSGVIAEASEVLRSYRVSHVVGDKYAGSFPAEQFRSHGIDYLPTDRDRSALYLDLLPRVNAGTVVLLDDAALVRELVGLERRRGASGRDRVDHRPGAHDDRANAMAGVVAVLARQSAYVGWDFYQPGGVDETDPKYQRIYQRKLRKLMSEDEAPERGA